MFQNIEHSWTMPTGELVYQLSGDDECPDGWFKSIVEFIREERIDYINHSICIYGDFKCLYPNGDYFIKENHMASKSFDLVSLNMRHFIGNRSACYSTSIMKKYFKVSRDRSYVAEWAQEIQLPFFTEKAYYIHKIGNIYYTRIGVNIGFNKKTLEERVDNFPYMKQCLESVGYKFNKKDARYVELQKLKYEQMVNWSLKRFILISFLDFLAKDRQYGLLHSEFMKRKRIAFAVLRRLPHKKPIKMSI